MLKTIELILGLPTMSIFGLIANDNEQQLHDQPVLTPIPRRPPETGPVRSQSAVDGLEGRRKILKRMPGGMPLAKRELVRGC